MHGTLDEPAGDGGSDGKGKGNGRGNGGRGKAKCKGKGEAKEGNGSAAVDIQAPKYKFGYDAELRVSWRHLPGLARSARELGEWKIPSDDSDPTRPMVCRWNDGQELEVGEVTVDMWKHWQDLIDQKQNHKSEVLYAGEHKNTHHAITVRRRVDRDLMVSLYEQGKQRLQIPVWKFALDGEETEGKDAEARAGEFLREIAIRYAAGTLTVKELYAERDKKLVEYFGNKTVRRTPLKKPAAASDKNPAAASDEAKPAPKSRKRKMKCQSRQLRPKHSKRRALLRQKGLSMISQ